ncbi:hypothetical protein MVEN_00536600 [Mycena venus]|uniref:O-fucosyltransferase family protein n=1 Tax=Mycena venus TaxID=2733690 RepID=A0A8H7D770_9AGAR|nr:hypothetical protein MVEN_00536600 [Mycena venus]
MKLSLRLLVFASTFLFGLYFIYRQLPPYGLYNTLTQSEYRASLDLDDRNSKKYVWFKQLQGAGFNNQVQEILLYHHLARLTNRVYVFQPLIWQRAPRHSPLPLSAFLSGVTNGTVAEAMFSEVCPPSETRHLTLDRENDALWDHAVTVLNGSDRCISIDNHFINWSFLASSAIRTIWSSFKEYLSSTFKWSAQILDIAERARPTEPYMALHLRRGDFEGHCDGLALSQTGFTTWGTLPELKDTVFPPKLNVNNYTSVMEHCYPSLRRILDAIDSQARVNPHVNTLHVLHDGSWDHPSVYLQFYKLEAAVKDPRRILKAGWKGGPMKTVTHSGTLPLRSGESDWGVAVDVELARKANIFIGNGYSSLSTQIVALRLAKEGARTKDITLL